MLKGTLTKQSVTKLDISTDSAQAEYKDYQTVQNSSEALKTLNINKSSVCTSSRFESSRVERPLQTSGEEPAGKDSFSLPTDNYMSLKNTENNEE